MALRKLVLDRHLPWRTRLMAAGNIMCFTYFTVMTISATILCWTDIIPSLISGDRQWRHKVFILFTFTNVLGNCYLCLYTDTSVKRLSDDGNSSKEVSNNKKITQNAKSTIPTAKTNRFKMSKIKTKSGNSKTDSSQNINGTFALGIADCANGAQTNTTRHRKSASSNSKEWKHKCVDDKVPNGKETKKVSEKSEVCEFCQIHRPVRTHHCKLCQTCVLKRDHHCFFLTVCIGYYNQKYFIMYCFYMMVGTFYSMILVCMKLKQVYHIQFYGPQTFVTLYFEAMRRFIMTTYPGTYYALLIYMLYGSLTACLIGAAIWFWQLQLVWFGQTSHEAMYGIYKYSRTRLLNLQDVFGRYWWLHLFLPIPLPQPSDGRYRNVANR